MVSHQIFVAVKRLHDLGIAHGDISPENIVVAEDDSGDTCSIRLIDFGLATFGRQDYGCHGKEPYVAPEMHWPDEYDAYLADSFALGVVLYILCTNDSLWSSTRTGANTCRVYGFIERNGFRKFCSTRRARTPDPQQLLQVLSEDLLKLLEGLLSTKAESRLTLGEACYEEEAKDLMLKPRETVWDCSWLDLEQIRPRTCSEGSASDVPTTAGASSPCRHSLDEDSSENDHDEVHDNDHDDH
jgi:serine/threonine protein kinase